jgi:hypothetical protein
VQEELELESLVALVADVNDGLQAVLGQRHAVYETEVVRPRLARFLRDTGGAQAEIELDGAGIERVLSGGLA